MTPISGNDKITTSSISRRLASCLEAFQNKDYENALIHYFPALDKTAKRRYPKLGVGARIRAFLKDEEALITAIATGNAFIGCKFNGITFEEAIYKFGRTAIAHEGELDPRLTFVDGTSWSIGDVWCLPSQYILGLCIAVMVAPENKREGIPENAQVTLFNRTWKVNQLWGNEKEIKDHISGVFKNPHLFS
jgi:hypothetical protein